MCERKRERGREDRGSEEEQKSRKKRDDAIPERGKGGRRGMIQLFVPRDEGEAETLVLKRG